MSTRDGRHYRKAPAPELSFLDVSSQTHPQCPDRPARVPGEEVRKLQQAEHIGDYNIWYGRYSGERNERRGKASTRCVLELDAGLTRADYTNPGACVCMHFARGCCINGRECGYRHCAPNEDDETQTDAPHDVFGRDRHGSFKDDMGGTGNWNKVRAPEALDTDALRVAHSCWRIRRSARHCTSARSAARTRNQC